MRAALQWSLAGTLALTSVALLWPAKGPSVVAAVGRAAAIRSGEVQQPEQNPLTRSVALPVELPVVQIEPARRDPFVQVLAPVPRVVTPMQAPAPGPPAPLAAAAPVAPPAPQVRYLGAMLTPQGQRLVLLAHGESAVTVQVGTVLDGGYVVQAIGPAAISLLYPSTGTLFDIPIPESARPTR